VGDFTHIAMARQSPTGVGSHNKTIAYRGGLLQRQSYRPRGGLSQQNHRPQGWAPTTKPIAHGVGTHNKTNRPRGGLPQRNQSLKGYGKNLRKVFLA
jgi:hypothetical protein